MILAILQSLQLFNNVIFYLYLVTLALAMLSTSAVTGALLSITVRCIETHGAMSKDVRIPEWDSLLKTLRFKSILMGIQIAVMALYSVAIVFQIIFCIRLPLRFVVFTILDRFFEISLAIILYINLQDQATKKGFFIGYFRRIHGIILRKPSNLASYDDDSDSDSIMTAPPPPDETGYENVVRVLAYRDAPIPLKIL